MKKKGDLSIAFFQNVQTHLQISGNAQSDTFIYLFIFSKKIQDLCLQSKR